MSATVYVVGRFVAKAGKEEQLKTVLNSLIAPTRREIGCYQFDLLESSTEPREFSIVERWDGKRGLDQHLASDYVQGALAKVEPLVEEPPDIRRYTLV
jgi:quinol monooxygenase YgiN